MTAQCNVANMTTWIEALESGDYPQVNNGTLYDGKGYCCLGVLHAVQGGTFRQEPSVWGTDDGHFGYPSVATVAWLGLDDPDYDSDVRVRDDSAPEPNAVDDPLTLASSENDNGTTFAGIAALLRARYLPTEVTS